MSRIVLTGTEKRLARPSGKDLALPNWDESYLDWVDLSGLKVPPMRDADCFHYRAEGTTFGNTDYIQLRYPLSLDGAVLPPDASSYNHDFIVGVLRQASNADHPGVKLVADHVGASYLNSWVDSIYRLINELKMTLEDVQDVFTVAFAGYPRLQSRLEWHVRNKYYRKGQPPTENTKVRVDEQEVELAPHLTTLDRNLLREELKQVVTQQTGKEAPVYVVWSVPHYIVLLQRWPV